MLLTHLPFAQKPWHRLFVRQVSQVRRPVKYLWVPSMARTCLVCVLSVGTLALTVLRGSHEAEPGVVTTSVVLLVPDVPDIALFLPVVPDPSTLDG